MPPPFLASFTTPRWAKSRTKSMAWCSVTQMSRPMNAAVVQHLLVLRSSYIPRHALQNDKAISNPSQFRPIVLSLFSKLTGLATANKSSLSYATDAVPYADNVTVYGLVQCTRDLSPAACRLCLNNSVNSISSCCIHKQGARVLSGSCVLRYEIYPFFGKFSKPTPLQPPAANGPISPGPLPHLRRDNPSGNSGRGFWRIMTILSTIGGGLLAACILLIVRARKHMVGTWLRSMLWMGFSPLNQIVYSFGILLLEIISGQLNRKFNRGHQEARSLVGFAWSLWSQGMGLEFVDPLLRETSPAPEILRCLHIGLLCVQEDAESRPTMSSVLLKLGGECSALPTPTIPAFSMRKIKDGFSKSQSSSVNGVTYTEVAPR